MNEPSNQTLKVMIESLEQKSDARHEDYQRRHDEDKENHIKMDAKLDKILEQTIKTNGRVNKHDWYFKASWWLMGTLTTIMFIGIPLLYKLYNYSLDVRLKTISEDVVSILQEKYNLEINE